MEVSATVGCELFEGFVPLDGVFLPAEFCLL